MRRVQRPTARAPLDLALVLDRSGSMGGAMWPRACAEARRMVERLDHRDRIALVVHDDKSDTLVPLGPVHGGTCDQVTSAL
jgi:Ca-activated chloride channel homolog